MVPPEQLVSSTASLFVNTTSYLKQNANSFIAKIRFLFSNKIHTCVDLFKNQIIQYEFLQHQY